jgi:[ribosomal protein S5]-alanine N-acetyltransferase
MMSLPDLVPLSAEQIAALLAGRDRVGFAVPAWWPDAHDAHFLQVRLRELRREPQHAAWSVRALVLDGELIGHAGFHGPPGVNAAGAADAVELGYTVFPAYRGRGHGRAAAQSLIDWAAAEHGIRHFVASAAPGNEASLAIIRGLGFEQTGSREDEHDGTELVFELRLGP